MKTKIIAFLLIFSAAASLSAQKIKNVPYDSSIYNFLDKAYARGWIYYLPQTRPYSEKKCFEYLLSVNEYLTEHPDEAAPIIKKQLYGYLKLLKDERYHNIKSKKKFLGTYGLFDFGFDTGLTAPLNRLGDSVPTVSQTFIGEMYSDIFFLGLESRTTLALIPYSTSPYRKFHKPYDADYNLYTWNLTSGSGGFNLNENHTPGHVDVSLLVNSKSQISLDLKLVSFHFGRESLSWGPSPNSNLSLSRTAKPYDYIRMDLPMGKKANFTWMTGFLRDADAKKIINTHRFEIQPFKCFQFAIYESVIYSNRFELGYINPFSLYYISEVMNGDHDNKLGGMDFVFRAPKAKIYFSVFADDWDLGKLFRTNYFHNECGFILGTQIFDIVPGLYMNFEYAHMSHWMYTHERHSNSYQHYGSHLGHYLNPNAHIAFMDIKYDIKPTLTVGTSFWFTQDGPTDIDSDPHNPGWDMGIYDDWNNYYNYMDYGISGAIRETNIDWTLSCEYRIPYYGVKIRGSYSLEYTKNEHKVAGRNRWNHIVGIEAAWLKH